MLLMSIEYLQHIMD